MIEAIKGDNYNTYGILNHPSGVVQSGQKVENSASFDIQKILSQIENYTYTDQDVAAVDKILVDELTKQLDISEQDVYELYKRGMDLEQLHLNEIAYYKGVSENHEVEEEGQKEEQDASLAEKIEVIKNGSDSMYLYALTSKEPITINSLYKNSYKGEYKKSITNYIKEDVSNVLRLNGVEENKSSQWATGLLMMHDMGVNVANINKLQNMQAAVSALDPEHMGSLSGEDELIKEEQVQYKPEYVERITDELGMVTDEHIEKLIEEGKEININELRESIHKNVDKALHDNQNTSHQQMADEGNETGDKTYVAPEQVEAVKKQILQITTKLTVEAAQRISSQMPLESSSIASVANALKQMEMDLAAEALTQAGVTPSEENMAIVMDTMSVKNDMSLSFNQTIQIQLESDETAQLNEIQTALAKYEANETPVEKRFGETVATVEGQIEHLLLSQGIEVTPENVLAAKALIANNMEVTAAQLSNMQEIVTKLNTFLDDFTPAMAAQMIKEGINPYYASVNDILSFMGDQKLEGLKNSIAETIVDMQAQGEIDESQKEGLIGLYRIIQGVTNNKAAVMGYLYKNELGLTVENLQMASKYVAGKKRISVSVDDNFGELQDLNTSSQTAKELLEESSQNSKKMQEIIKSLEEMALPITDENISKVSKISAMLYPYIKEQFKKEMGRFDGLNTLPSSFLEKLETVSHVQPEVIENMLSQEIPLTVANIYWMDQMTKNPELYTELLDANGMLKEDLPKDLEELEEILTKAQEEAQVNKEEATLRGDVNAYRRYKQLEEVVNFERQRIEKEGVYQIPFMIDGERRLINLYVYPDDKSGAVAKDDHHLKAVISYETKHLGSVKAYVEIQNEQIGFKIEAEKPESTKAFSEQIQVLVDRLQDIGYHTGYSEFVGVTKENDKTSERINYKHEDSNFEEII